MDCNNHCEFCDELSGGKLGLALWPRLAPACRRDRIIDQNDSYVCLVTAGPIARGHCLIVPRSHRSAISGTDDSDRYSLTNLLVRVSARMRRIYGQNVLLFEHGAPEGSEERPCTVSHAHWHLVPSSLDAGEMTRPGYNWQPTQSPFVRSDRQYLLVGDAEDRHWVAYSDAPIPSQLLRMHFASRLGDRLNWDWRSQPSVEVMLATLGDFRSLSG